MNFFRTSYVAKNRSPLTDAEMLKKAPSIFAMQAHESRSERYGYIPTIDVINGLRKEGFEPFSVIQARARDAGKIGHAKHMIRLRHVDQMSGPEANEIVMVNSHDGSSSYHMMAGQFRQVCSNGLVCGDFDQDIRVRHNGSVVHNVIEGAFQVLTQFDRVNEQKEGMKTMTLDDEEQLLFANAALSLRYEGAEHGLSPIKPLQLLNSRRIEDRKNDLYTVFNRVQENVIRGGLPSRSANGNRTTTREIAGIDQNVKLNRALWLLADGMRQLKTPSSIAA